MNKLTKKTQRNENTEISQKKNLKTKKCKEYKMNKEKAHWMIKKNYNKTKEQKISRN